MERPHSTRLAPQADREPLALQPTIIYALGETGAAGAEEARMRIQRALGSIPPYYAFLSLRQAAGPRHDLSLRIGEQPEEHETSEAASEPLEQAGTLFRRALSAVTKIRRELDAAIQRDVPGLLERVEIIVAGSLAEIESFELINYPLRAVEHHQHPFWRLGVFWAGVSGDLAPAAEEAERRSVAAHLAALDAAQVEVEGCVRKNLFHACIALDSPGPDGLNTLQASDRVLLTGAFLGCYLASGAGAALRAVFHPQPDPAQFHIGFAERRYDMQAVSRSLAGLWFAKLDEVAWSEPHRTLDLPQRGAEALSVAALRRRTGEEAEAEIRKFVESAIAEAGLGNEKAGETTTARCEKGFLSRAGSILRQHLEALQRSWNEWQRELEDRHLELSLLRLRRKQAPEEPLHARRQPLWFVPLLVAPIIFFPLAIWTTGLSLFWAGFAAPVVPAFWAGAFFLLRASRKAAELRAEALRAEQATFEEREKRAEELEHEIEHARRILDGTETTPSGGHDGEELPGGLLPAISFLEGAYLQIVLLRQDLAALKPPASGNESGFTRNVLSPADLALLFSWLLERQTAPPGNGSTTAPHGGDDPAAAAALRALHKALGGGGLEALFRHGHDLFLRRLEEHGRQLFQRCERMSLHELFANLERASGQGGIVAGFFSSLARNAPVLWKLHHDDWFAEHVFLIHSAPWGSKMVRAAQEVIGKCQPLKAPGSGEIVLLKVLRGQSWKVGES
jgi:hypothetical protein